MKTIQNIETKLLKSINIDSKIPEGFTDILDDKINGFWNGSKWVESASPKEVEAHNQQIETAQKKIERETLLKSGIVVDSFWFNEYYLAQFISLIGVCERGNKKIEWKNTNGNWETLSVSDANKIAFNASIKFQQIYKNT